MQQQQLLGSRLANLTMLGAGLVPGDSNAAMYRFASSALAIGCKEPDALWHRLDHAGLLQVEAQRGIAIARAVGRWHGEFGNDRTPERAFTLLAHALNGQAQGQSVLLPSTASFTSLLDAAPGEMPQSDATGWLAWLLWWNEPIELTASAKGDLASQWILKPSTVGSSENAPPNDWLERMIEDLTEG